MTVYNLALKAMFTYNEQAKKEIIFGNGIK